MASVQCQTRLQNGSQNRETTPREFVPLGSCVVKLQRYESSDLLTIKCFTASDNSIAPVLLPHRSVAHISVSDCLQGLQTIASDKSMGLNANSICARTSVTFYWQYVVVYCNKGEN